MENVIVAMDSFKGSISSVEACKIVATEFIACGTKRVSEIPIADGGEGTIDAFLLAVGGEKQEVIITGPNWQKITSHFAILSDGETAVIEMALASGLILANPPNPWDTTTYGTGELIKAALDAGCRRLIIGIGGSATNDGGTGMAVALGVKFLSLEGNEIIPSGGGLEDIAGIDSTGLDKRINNVDIIVACDVKNLFYGNQGASLVYSQQKGANKNMAVRLDKHLKKLAEVIKNQYNVDLQKVPGSGAAGGLGGALHVFLGAKLRSGIEILLEVVNFPEKLKHASLVITGEGSFDYQSLYGKTVSGIAKIAKEYGVPVIVLAGSIMVSAKEYEPLGILATFSTNQRPISLREAKHEIAKNLKAVSRSLAGLTKEICNSLK